MKKSRILKSVTLAILAFPLAPAATAGPLDIWTWRNPLPTGNALYGISHGLINGNGLFVAVGTNSTIVTSPDGTNWQQQIAPPGSSLSAVAAGPGGFVAVGADTATGTINVILTSPDGTNWSANNQAGGVGNNGFLAVAYGGGEFMAVGNGGVNWYSSDGGSTWSRGSTPAGAPNLNGVAYGNGMFVAVGDDGYIFTSPGAGGLWTQQATNLTSDDLDGIAYGGSTNGFVAVGPHDLLNSPDGATWHDEGLPGGESADAVVHGTDVYGNNIFVVVSDATYQNFTSPGGSGVDTWTSFVYVTGFYNAIAWDGTNTFVSVGGPFTIATSTTGTNWNALNLSMSGGSAVSLNAIAYGTTFGGTNLFVAGGISGQFLGVAASTNGFNWKSGSPSLPGSLSYYATIIGLGYGAIGPNNTPEFVAAANISRAAGILPYNSFIISSSNGVAWTTNDYIPIASGISLSGITYGTNAAGTPMFVAVGSDASGGASVSSSDLKTWRTNSSAAPSTPLNAVTAGGGAFVAVGSLGTVASSSDGIHWIAFWDGDMNGDNLNGVTYGNGQFVAVGTGGVIYTWSPGTTPIAQSSGTTAPLDGVTFGNGLFVAVSGLPNAYVGSGVILVSTNGVNWTQSSVGAPIPLNAVAYGYNGQYGQFIAVGGFDILGSVLATSSITVVGGTPQITVCGPPGTTFEVYVSYNLTSWAPLGEVTFTSSNPCQSVNDPNAGNNAQGYYYLGLPP